MSTETHGLDAAGLEAAWDAAIEADSNGESVIEAAISAYLVTPSAATPAGEGTQQQMNQAFYVDVCNAERRIKEFVTAGQALLDTLPSHWHDEAIVEFADLVRSTGVVLHPERYTPQQVKVASEAYYGKAHYATLASQPPAPPVSPAPTGDEASAQPVADTRLHCNHCPALFSTVWERAEHERESHAPVSSELEAMRKERDDLRHDIERHIEIASAEATRAEAAESALAEANRKLDVAVEALRRNFCPRAANNRPDDFTVGQCFDAGECACMNGDALRSRPGEAG